MVQTFEDFPATQKIRDSRPKIAARDEALRSCFSGTAFPTDPAPVVGQYCFRTDEKKLYQCREATGPIWVEQPTFINALTATVLRAIDAAAHVPSGAIALLLETEIAFYRYDPASEDAHNGTTVLRPSVGAASTGAGRWLLVFSGSPASEAMTPVLEETTVARAMARLGGPNWINVKNPTYGALGDGSNDDTAEIAAAITAGGASGATIYFPHGTYIISDNLEPLANQVWIFDRGAKLKFASGTSSKDAIRIGASADDVTLIDAYVDGNAANTTSCGGITVYGDRCVLIRPKVRDVDGYGIYLGANTDDTYIIDKDIGGTVGNIGIFLDGGTNTATKNGPRIEGGRVDRSAMPASLTQGGIQIRGSSSYPLKGGYVRNVEVRMPTSPNDSSNLCIEVRNAPGFKADGCTTFGGSMGVSLDHCPSAIASDCSIKGFAINGIEIANSSDGASVSGGTIDADGVTGTTGVAIQGATGTNDDVSVDGTTILGCDTRGVYGYASERMVLSNVTVKMVGGDAVYIQEQEGWAIGGSTLDGGDTPTATNGVVISGSTGEGTIYGTLIQNFATNGVLLTASSAITIDDIAIVGNTFKGNGAAITTTLSGGATIGSNVKVLGNPGATDYVDFANLLPLYQAGTFTPTVTSSTPGDLSVSYTTQVGNYQRVGKWVQIEINLNFTPTYTTATGAVRIGGLPLAAVASANPSDFVLTDITAFNWPASRTQLVPVANSGQSYITIQALGSGVSPSELAITDKASGSGAILRIRGRYRVAA